MARQTYTIGQVLTAAQMTQLQANDYNQTVSAKVASYVLVAADAGTRITMSNAAATTVTVNTALFTAGDTLTITNIGTGVCTVTAGTATVSTAGSLALNQYDSGTLYFTSTGVSIWNGANPGDITGVTAGTGISGGGTSGDVTITNSMATAITTAGDLIKGTGSGTFNRLGIGSTGQVLTVASGAPSWATPAGGGKVLQVVTASYSTLTATTSTTSVDTGITATITPAAASSKILIFYSFDIMRQNSTDVDSACYFSLVRTATTIGGELTIENYQQAINSQLIVPVTYHYYDSPSTTSATTYKVQFRSNTSTITTTVQVSSRPSQITLMEIGA